MARSRRLFLRSPRLTQRRRWALSVGDWAFGEPRNWAILLSTQGITGGSCEPGRGKTCQNHATYSQESIGENGILT
jgi:hypothetical protein